MPVPGNSAGSDFAQETLEQIESFFGIKLDDDDSLTQFWATDRFDRSGNSTLNDHGYVTQEGNLYRFPTYIPVSMIANSKEGDTLRINGDQGIHSAMPAETVSVLPIRQVRRGFERPLRSCEKVTRGRHREGNIPLPVCLSFLLKDST